MHTFAHLDSTTSRPICQYHHRLAGIDQKSILWYTSCKPEWRNRQTRATQNRVGLAHVGSIPTSGMWAVRTGPLRSVAAFLGGKCAQKRRFLLQGVPRRNRGKQ